jgi:Arc/MetJ-type ribon-helix-helix transcriptional regulator
MTRRPVTVTDDLMELVEGATAMDRYASRSELLREAFRENEVLIAVVLAAADDIDPVDGIAAVDCGASVTQRRPCSRFDERQSATTTSTTRIRPTGTSGVVSTPTASQPRPTTATSTRRGPRKARIAR